MAQKDSALHNLWEAASQEYELGNYDQFKTSMANPQARKGLYDALQANYELGTFDDFDSTMTKELDELNKHYIDSLWSDAKNNNYDLSTPRDFKSKMTDEAYRQKFYESYTADGHDLGSYEDFNGKVANALKANEPKTWIGRKAENLWNATKSGLMTVGNQAMDLGNLAMGLDIYTPVYSTKTIDTAQKMLQIGATPLSERRAAQERVAKGEGTEWDKELSGSLDVADKAAERQSEVAQDARRDIGEDDNFVDLIKHGNIGGAMELGMITALESAPQMLLGHNAVGRVLLGTLSAADEYDRLTKERPNMSNGARVAQAVFHGAIEQLWERWGNPLKLGKAKAKVGGGITRQIREFATKEWKQKLKTVGKGVLEWLKEATDEGMEEVMTDLCNNIFDTLLGAADENGEGLVKEYKEAAAAAAENGEELTKQQFALNKAKEMLNSFIGGAAAGGIMGAGSAVVNQSVAHHAKYQVQEEDGKTRRMTKEERKQARQTADMAMRAIDKIAQEDGISRTEVLDKIDEEEQDRQDIQEALNDWADFIPNEQSQEDVIGDYTKRYHDILAQEVAELRRGIEANEESTTETPATTTENTAEENTQTQEETEAPIQDGGTPAQAEGNEQQTTYHYKDPKSKKAYEFVRNADGTFYMLKDGKPVTTHTWTTDELADKGWKYLSDRKDIRQQQIIINLNGQPEPVRFSCINAVFNEDGSLNMEEIDPKRLFVFPNGSLKYGNGRFPKEERDNVIAALQEALIKEKEAKDAERQVKIHEDLRHGTKHEQPAYIPGVTPANALTAEQQAAAEAERIKAEEERKKQEEIKRLREEAPYPTKEDGSPDYEQMTPEQQADYVNEKYGAEAVGEMVKNAIAELNAQLEGTGKKKGLTPAERMETTMAIRQQITAWEEAGEKYAEEEPGETPQGEGEGEGAPPVGEGAGTPPVGGNTPPIGGGGEGVPPAGEGGNIPPKGGNIPPAGEGGGGGIPPLGGNPPIKGWKPDEVVDLQDGDVVVLLHYTREHYPLVKIARVTEEDGKRVYHEIGKEGNIIDAEKGNWHEMTEKKIVEDENGVQYLFIDFDGRIKRRGIPLLATNEQLEAINQQNRPKATGLKGLTELKQAPSNLVADEELSNMQAALEKPLIKASGTKRTLSLLDILSLRPYATEVTEMTKDKDGNDVPKKSIKVISIWQQIAQICDKMARESQATTNEKYGKQADELQIAEQANALLQDFKRAYKKQLDAWNKLVRKNNIDQLIAEHIDEIDPELIAAYRALHEKIYGSAKEGNPSATVQTTFDGSRFKNTDDNIFRYMQVVSDMARQACNASGITDVEDVLDMAVLKETPWRDTSKEVRRKAGGKTVEDTKKEILDSLDLDNIHSAEEILQIKQRVGKMRKLLEDKEFEQDYLEKVQVAEEKYGRTDEIEDTPEAKAKKKAKGKEKGDEIKTLQLALAAAQKKGDTERALKIENRLKELQGEEAAAADAKTEEDTTPKDDAPKTPEEKTNETPEEKTNETPEERQKRYDQLRAQQDYFWEQKMKAHADGDTAAEAQADAMVKRIGEELDKMDDEAEMQRGQSVMPNATPAQRFVTNVVLKALKNIRGITVHHATKADVERMLARLKDNKAEMQRKNANTSFNQFLQDYIAGRAERNQIWHANIDGVLRYLTNGKELSVRQAVLNKAAKKHNIDLNSLGNLIDKLSNPIAVFKSAREDVNGKVVLIDAKDNAGKPIIVAINMDSNQNGMEVNDVTSVYGRENIEDFVRWAEKDLLEDGNREKFEALITSLPEYNSLGERKSALQELAAKIGEKSETTKSEGEIEPLTTSDGTIYGWSVGNEIWLTDEGLNPETPIHEFLHLFVKAMAQENGKEWQRVVELCKRNTTLWNEVVNDPNYKHLQNIEDEAQRDSAIASEMLARYGGKRGAEQMNEKATQMEKEGHSFESDAAAKLLVGRMKKALREVYQWALDKLGIPHHYKSIDEVVDKGLYDLLSESRIDIADFTAEEQNIVDRAKADGTYMKAPNGQPTNLTPKQWAQTRTEAFKKWFGDWEKDPANASKCIDENGEPKIVYRGSKNANSYVFHTRYENAGYWFSDNKSVAEHYARRGADHELSQEELDERVQPCFLNVRRSEHIDAGGRTWQNVYEQPRYAIYDDETGHIKAEFDARAEAEQYCAENGLDPYIEIEENNGISGDIAESRIANGLDGMEFQNMIDGNAKDHTDVPSNVWVTKDNTQAKSAEENSGEFDSTNPDIRFQVGRTKAEIEAQIESGDISKVDLEAEMYVKTQSHAYAQRKYDPSVPMPEQLTKLQGLRTSALDEGYGLHLLRHRMDAVRKAQGKKAVNRDKYDIRALREQSEAATAGKQKLLNDRQLHDLALVLYGKGRKNKGLIGAIEKSALLKKYKTETLIDQNGKQQTVTLSAQDLLNRYLIARDNIERIELGIPPRGLAEFKQRMGVDMVDFMREFQEAFGTETLTELHRRIKAVTDVSLDALHDAGMLTDEQYEIYKSRKFYVPEKGYEDQNQQSAITEFSKDIWEKVKGAITKGFAIDGHVGAKTDGAKQGVKPMATSYRARGGDSLGTDIIEHIVQDTYDAIAKAEQNKVKRAMYDLLREDPTVTRAMRLPVPEEVYYVKNEKGEWVRKTDGITAEERADAAAIDYQIRMLESEAATTTDEETLNDIYQEIDGLLAMRPFADEYTARNVWQSEQEVRQESVGVWVNGVLQEMRFPNMVQVANALNGRRNTEKAIAAAREVNGWIASICTNFNPTFFATNIVRDVPFIMKKGSSEYGFEFAAYFTKNLADPRIQKSIWSYIAGNLDETDGGRFSSDFYDFVTGGGQTGYARTPEIDELRKKLNKWQKTGFGWREILDAGPKLNEWSELYTRFAAYEAVLQMGKSKEEALKAAKNCSVNFNRRGFGGPIINIVNSLSMFANATIQGAMGFYTAFGGELQEGDSRAKRIARAGTSFIALPILWGLVSTFLTPDDDDDESVIPDWERDNYMCLGDFRIPLNEQVKPFFLIGTNAALMMQGRRDWSDAIVSLSTACAQNLVPCSPVVNETVALSIQKMAGEKDMPWERVLQNLWTPQALRSMNYVAEGKDWLGNDLRKDYAAIPEWRMGDSQAQMYKDLAYFGYRMGGGNKDYYSTYNEGKPIGYNRNPKEIKNNPIFQAIPGGYLNIAETVWGLGHALFTDDSVSESVRVKDIPIVNRFYKPTSPEMYRYNIYKQCREELQAYQDQKQTLKPQAEGGNAAADQELKRVDREMIGRNIKAAETDSKNSSTESNMRSLQQIMKEYNNISLYKTAKKLGLNEKEYEQELIKRIGKEKAEERLKNIDEEEKNLIREMRQWLIENKGVKLMMDGDGKTHIERPKK